MATILQLRVHEQIQEVARVGHKLGRDRRLSLAAQAGVNPRGGQDDPVAFGRDGGAQGRGGPPSMRTTCMRTVMVSSGVGPVNTEVVWIVFQQLSKPKTT